VETLFPDVHSNQEFAPFRRDERALGAGVRAICDRLALSAASVSRFPEGTQPVYSVGEQQVLKIFPPFDRRQCEVEAAVLDAVDRRLSIPTPSLCAVGELEGWSYMLMQRLPGESLAEAWPRIPPDEQLRLASVLGESLATLHATRAPDLPALRSDWTQFLAEQSMSCVQRQRGHGVDELWIDQIPEFLRSTSLAPPASASLLHTEVMREHLLVTNGPGGWVLSGLIDFESCMQGAAEYEFGAVGLFFACDTPGVLRRVFRGYGYEAAQLDAALQHRLMAYTLLHRYSNLRWYLNRMPPTAGEQTLEALARQWWALSAD
jgi:hygromycin-B 7''-O-kinase